MSIADRTVDDGSVALEGTEISRERPLVTVLVPAYNESLMLKDSLTEIYEYMQSLESRYRFEVLVVDDGSTDGTYDIATEFASTRPEVRLRRQPSNMRLGQAIRDGVQLSHGDIVVVFDSDLSYAVDHIGRMLDAMEREHADMVVASPYMAEGQTTAIPWRRGAMSRQVNRLLAASSQYPIKTVTSMVRAYRGPFIRSLSLKSMGPEINTEILYKAQILRARVCEIPAHLDWSGQQERIKSRHVPLRVSTTSKLLVFASFLFRPIFFFVVPGLVLLFISLWSAASLLWTVLDVSRGIDGIDHRLTDGFALAWESGRRRSFLPASRSSSRSSSSAWGYWRRRRSATSRSSSLRSPVAPTRPNPRRRLHEGCRRREVWFPVRLLAGACWRAGGWLGWLVADA